MKNKNTQKLFALLLAGSMSLAMISGCGQAEKNPAESANTSKTAEEDSTKDAENASSTEAEEEPAVLTIGINSSTGIQTDPVPMLETEVMQVIQEMANVKLELLEYDADTFRLLQASNDLPDIFMAGKASVDTLIESGVALNMTPLLEEHAPNVLLDLYSMRNELLSTMSGGKDNGLYFMAPRVGVENANGNVNVNRGYVVRWDWYLEIGAPEIKNDDDYIDVIEKMVKAHPETEDGEKVWGYSIYDNYSYWTMRAPYTKAIALNNNTFTNTQYMSSYVDGSLINGYTDIERSAYWTDMKFFNKLYNRGLLDPDSFTQPGESLVAKWTSGRVAADGYRDQDMYNAMRETDPDTLAGFVVVPSENTVVFANKHVPTGYFPTTAMCVNAKSENVEACMRFVNVLHDPDVQRMLWSGIEGEHWYYDEKGVPRLTDEMLKIKSEEGDELKKIGIYKTNPAFLLFEGGVEHPDGYPMNLFDSDEMRAATLTPLDKSFSEHYGVQYPAQALMNLVEEGKTIDLSGECGQFVASGIPAMPDDIKRITTTCKEIIYKSVAKLVTAPTEEEFAKVQAEVLAELEEAGEPVAWEWCSKHYNESKDKVWPIFEKYKANIK